MLLIIIVFSGLAPAWSNCEIFEFNEMWKGRERKGEEQEIWIFRARICRVACISRGPGILSLKSGKDVVAFSRRQQETRNSDLPLP